jgi:hypothetical protein
MVVGVNDFQTEEERQIPTSIDPALSASKSRD